MSVQVQVNGAGDFGTKRVWYSGTDQLEVGYALAYDVAALVGSAAASQKQQRGVQVTKPATANLFAFAGIVSIKPDRVGPCWVDIITPAGTKGEHVLARTKINATAYTTALGLVNDDYALGAFADATLNFGLVAIAAETADTSATAAVKLIRLL